VVTWYLSLFLLIYDLPTERVVLFGFGMEKWEVARAVAIAKTYYRTINHAVNGAIFVTLLAAVTPPNAPVSLGLFTPIAVDHFLF
jgi:hypothetical protein